MKPLRALVALAITSSAVLAGCGDQASAKAEPSAKPAASAKATATSTAAATATAAPKKDDSGW